MMGNGRYLRRTMRRYRPYAFGGAVNTVVSRTPSAHQLYHTCHTLIMHQVCTYHVPCTRYAFLLQTRA